VVVILPSRYCGKRVCLSDFLYLCPQAYLRNRTSELHQLLLLLLMDVARSSFGGVVIHYVLPVLLMTSYLLISLNVQDRRREKAYKSESTRQQDLTRRGVLKLTHQGRHGSGTESAVYDCLVAVLFSAAWLLCVQTWGCMSKPLLWNAADRPRVSTAPLGCICPLRHA